MDNFYKDIAKHTSIFFGALITSVTLCFAADSDSNLLFAQNGRPSLIMAGLLGWNFSSNCGKDIEKEKIHNLEKSERDRLALMTLNLLQARSDNEQQDLLYGSMR